MNYRTALAVGATVLLALAAPEAKAEEPFGKAFNGLLVNGQTSNAHALAADQDRITNGAAETRFAMGIAQFLLAVEGFGQDLFHYGYTSDPGGVTALFLGPPALQLPIPRNPAPAPITYDSARQILVDFRSALEAAERTLSEVPPGKVGLRINLASVRLDLNNDGTGSFEERIGKLAEAATGLRFLDTDPSIRFDESDVPWLRGYCHLLMAAIDFALAHDWREAFDATSYRLFPQSDLPSRPLADQLAKQKLRLSTSTPGPSFYDLYNYSMDTDDPLYQEWASSEAGKQYLSYQRDENAVFVAGIADFIGLLHLMHWEVVDPEKRRSSREHLLAMIALSRANWDLILQETDDDSEWLPSPRQTSLFPSMQVDQARVEAWLRFLDQFESVLDGRLLLPHWRFDLDRGLNIKRFFDEPTPFDLVMLIHGKDALAYLEEGTVAAEATADVAFQVFQRGFLAYFIWFN